MLYIATFVNFVFPMRRFPPNLAFAFLQQVALNLWLHQNIEAVVSMYEDRFDLRILQSQPVEEPSKSISENLGWWDKYFGKNSGTRISPLHHVVIGHFSMPVKRTKELRALTGW